MNDSGLASQSTNKDLLFSSFFFHLPALSFNLVSALVMSASRLRQRATILYSSPVMFVCMYIYVYRLYLICTVFVPLPWLSVVIIRMRKWKGRVLLWNNDHQSPERRWPDPNPLPLWCWSVELQCNTAWQCIQSLCHAGAIGTIPLSLRLY